jgi:pimeloyl-ACP methyl ester carboxylesterase
VTRGVAGVLVLVTVLGAACSSNTGLVARGRVPPATVAAGNVDWGDCGEGFECGSVHVPLDYSHPDGRKISLALIRKRATGMGRPVGSLLMNPGGPGGSGVDFLRSSASDFSSLNTYFDLVSWDPRGVGASAPVICYSSKQLDTYLALDSVLADPQEKTTFVRAVQDFTASCERRNGDLLPFMDSSSTARDMDRIREALGDPRLTYLGFSYGTYIAQWYAHLFPVHVRAMALDGVVDPTLASDPSASFEIGAFQQNLDAFFASCKADPACTYAASGDPAVKLKAAVEALDVRPLKVGDRDLTRSLALRAVMASLYDENYWPDLDQALTALEKGDGKPMLDIADSFDGRYPDGSYDNSSNGGYQATACLDAAAPPDLATYDAAGPAMARESPLLGPFVQYGDLECTFWPVKPQHLGESLTITGVPPILLVGATNDPATPYGDAKSVARQIPSSVLLTREGNGHTSYSASRCIQDAEDAYLVKLTLPASNTLCRS